MIVWAQLAGDVNDLISESASAKSTISDDKVARLDSRIAEFVQAGVATLPLLPSDRAPEPQHLRQHALVHTRFNSLRLLLHRRTMISLSYDDNTGRLCGDLAIDTVRYMKMHAHEIKSVSSFRNHMAASLASSILILSTLLLHTLNPLRLHDRMTAYAENFREAVRILTEISTHLQVARRILDDYQEMIYAVKTELNGLTTDTFNWAKKPQFSPDNFPVQTRIGMLRQSGLSAETWEGEPQQPDFRTYGVPWI
jgi:hypothetical protein